MGIPLGTAPISNLELMDHLLGTKDNTTRRIAKSELKPFLDGLDFCLDTGTANTYVLTPTVPITSYVAGQVYKFKALNANTGASTINISGVGVKNLVKSGNVALAAGDIPKDAIISTIYDGTNFQIIPDYATSLSEKAKDTDSARTTTNKTVTGAINELNSKLVDSGWNNIALNSGFAQRTGDIYKFRYRKVGNFVQLAGQATTSYVSTTAIIITLPVGYRPTNEIGFLILLENGSVSNGWIDIGGNVNIKVPAIVGGSTISLEGINFLIN
jgi:hypothetical protein